MVGQARHNGAFDLAPDQRDGDVHVPFGHSGAAVSRWAKLERTARFQQVGVVVRDDAKHRPVALAVDRRVLDPREQVWVDDGADGAREITDEGVPNTLTGDVAIGLLFEEGRLTELRK